MKIFVDTSALVTLYNPKEGKYSLAQFILRSLDFSTTELVTSNYVIAEALTVISQRVSKEAALKFREQNVPTFTVIRVDQDLDDQAFEIFKKIKSKNVSFVDCTSFALMQSLGIKTVFTFDKDFKKQGFRILQ